MSAIRIGDHATGADLIAQAWGGDAEGVDPDGYYKRVRGRALGRASIAASPSRRWYFIRVPRPLTPRQAEVLAFIEDSIALNGRPPSMRDHLKALEAKGYIRRDTGARGIAVVFSDDAGVDWKRRALAAQAEIMRLQSRIDELEGAA